MKRRTEIRRLGPKTALLAGLALFSALTPNQARAYDRDVVAVQRAMQEVAEAVEAGEELTELRFADESDWVRMQSGEWLRGRIDSSRDDIMQFDSDEFGPVDINARDIGEIHSPRVKTFIFDDRSSLRGSAYITRDKVVIATEDGVEIRDRFSIWAVVEGGVRELDRWSMRLDLGVTGSRGNANQLDANLGFRLVREDRRTLSTIHYQGSLGLSDDALSVSRHLTGFALKVWLTRRAFVYPVIGQLVSNRYQDVALRATPALAAGLRVVDTPVFKWDLSSGLGYQYLRLFDPLAGVDNPQHDAALPISLWMRLDITSDHYLVLSWLTTIAYTNLGNTSHTGQADLFLEVTNIFYLNASFLFLRMEDPYPSADGTDPLPNDFALSLGISLQLG